MKPITRLISVITGAISSLFTVGCMKEAKDVYGPPATYGDYKKSVENEDVKAPADAAKPENESAPEFPESEETPKRIYGPPEMLMGTESDNPSDDNGNDEKAKKQDFEALKEVNSD